MKIYSIRDTVAVYFERPFYARTNGEAIRSFSDAVNEPKSPFNAHPEQFLLYEVGDFDEQTGKINAIEPISLGSGLDFKAQ